MRFLWVLSLLLCGLAGGSNPTVWMTFPCPGPLFFVPVVVCCCGSCLFTLSLSLPSDIMSCLVAVVRQIPVPSDWTVQKSTCFKVTIETVYDGKHLFQVTKLCVMAVLASPSNSTFWRHVLVVVWASLLRTPSLWTVLGRVCTEFRHKNNKMIRCLKEVFKVVFDIYSYSVSRFDIMIMHTSLTGR